MLTRPRQDGHPYFHGVRRFILEGGERFATVVDHENAPAYYPTCYALMRRETAQSVETLVADARDLVHLGLWAQCERIDIVARMDSGRHLDATAEIASLVEACAIKAAPFRRLVAGGVSEIRRGASFTSRDVVTNAQKARRLATAARFLDYICRFAESWLPANDPELARRIEARAAMKAGIVEARPRLRSSRVRGVIPAADLARVVAYAASAEPTSIWKNKPVAQRNWLLVHMLVTLGLRQGEARQMKVEDVDLTTCEMNVLRKHDDPEDPRVREPNAKTYDRTIPFGHRFADILANYIFESGSDAATKSGSPFLLLSHSNRNLGSPISEQTPIETVRSLGEHLGIADLTPHHLRHAWIQAFARWSIESGLSPNEFDRLANYLGGWSYMSDMASRYRADQLTEEAYKAGLKIQEARA